MFPPPALGWRGTSHDSRSALAQPLPDPIRSGVHRFIDAPKTPYECSFRRSGSAGILPAVPWASRPHPRGAGMDSLAPHSHIRVSAIPAHTTARCTSIDADSPLWYSGFGHILLPLGLRRLATHFASGSLASQRSVHAALTTPRSSTVVQYVTSHACYGGPATGQAAFPAGCPSRQSPLDDHLLSTAFQLAALTQAAKSP